VLRVLLSYQACELACVQAWVTFSAHPPDEPVEAFAMSGGPFSFSRHSVGLSGCNTPAWPRLCSSHPHRPLGLHSHMTWWATSSGMGHRMWRIAWCCALVGGTAGACVRALRLRVGRPVCHLQVLGARVLAAGVSLHILLYGPCGRMYVCRHDHAHVAVGISVCSRCAASANCCAGSLI
jgi:hypothetical protein